MKAYITLLLLAAGSAAARAQGPRLVDQHIPLGAGSSVKLDLQIVDSIQVVTWDKKEVWVKGSIDVNDNKENDKYVVTFDNEASELGVKSRLEKTSDNKHCNCNCNNVQATFTVYVPEGTDVSVETINGDITITGQPGAVRAHSISGFVDMAVNPQQKADLTFRTISGNMYSNLDLHVPDEHNLRQVGGNVTTSLNGGGGKSIDLETISGDIFLRKAKEG